MVSDRVFGVALRLVVASYSHNAIWWSPVASRWHNSLRSLVGVHRCPRIEVALDVWSWYVHRGRRIRCIAPVVNPSTPFI